MATRRDSAAPSPPRAASRAIPGSSAVRCSGQRCRCLRGSGVDNGGGVAACSWPRASRTLRRSWRRSPSYWFEKSWVGEESTMPWVLILSTPFLARCIILGLSSSRFPSRISRRSFGIIPNPPTTYSAAGRWREKMRSSKSRPSRRQASAV